MSAHTTIDSLRPEAAARFAATPVMRRICQVLVVFGVLAFGAGLFVDPARAWANWLLSGFYFTTVTLGAFFVLASATLTTAAWHITIKRVFEAFWAWLPIGLFVTLVLLAGAGVIYDWIGHHDDGSLHSQLLEHKAPWLNLPFFVIRIFIYFAVWISVTRWMIRSSRKQDFDGSVVHTDHQRRAAAVYIVTMALTLSLASFDWLMSLDSTWFSTMYGVYQFAGAWESGLAMVIVVLVILRRCGWLKHSVTENHMHSLGQWLFATAVFWAYIWFFQWMLIWYANIPEETQYFIKRSQGAWWHVSYVVNPLFNFLLPFLLLLPRKAKRSQAMLLRVAVVILIGHWIDLWVAILPVTNPELSIGFLEVGVFAGFLGAFGWVVLRELGKSSLVPLNDPYFEESLNIHT